MTIFGHGTNYAVWGLDTLKSIILPNSVTLVNHNAVKQCDNLESVTIPDSVTEIGRNAFRDNASLSKVTIGNNVQKIGYSAFLNDPSLKSITLPASLTEIGDEAFGYCDNPGLVFGDVLARQPRSSFLGCLSVTASFVFNAQATGVESS